MKEKFLFKYKFFPFSENPIKGFTAIFLIFIISVLVFYAFQSPFYSLLAFIFLAFSMSSFFYPTDYIFFDEHLKIKKPFVSVSEEWTKYKSFHVDKNGILISPFRSPSRLENFRGIHIHVSDTKVKEKIIEILKEKIRKEDGNL